MKLTAEQQTLVAALETASGVIEKRNTIPALAGVLLIAEDGRLTVRSTDLDVSVDTRVECVVEQPGSTVVQADLLLGVVKRMRKGCIVTLALTDGRLHVTSGKRNFDFGTLDADTFPEIACEQYEAEFDMPADDLHRLLKKTAFAMSNEETRYFLQGVYLHPAENGVTAVATDGHRLAKAWSEQSDVFPGVIVPRKTVGELNKVLSRAIGSVSVSVSETKIKVDLGDTVIISKVVDGTFPDYTRVIPQGLPNSARVDAVEFVAAASGVALVSEDKARAVAICVGDDAIRLEVKGGAHKAEDEVEAIVTGEGAVIGINVKYMETILAQAEGGDVDLCYKGGGDPVMFKPTEDDKFLAVCMPMRL